MIARQGFGSGLANYALTYGFQLTSLLSFTSQYAAQLEVQMNAVERIQEYSVIEQESPWRVPNNTPPKEWPSKGEVVFEKACLRYRENTPLVLDKVSFKITPGEKVGIVGRTGAGKSTIMLALLRIKELCEGSVKIDGVDISKIGLHDLREKVGIIPQEPVLFVGTIRENLDPANQHSDKTIWEALKLVNLDKKMGEEGLESPVQEGGDNFSVGQKQLLCLARAIIKAPKILLMDEATASVDVESDELIQNAIREQFSKSTIVAIAHRLNSLLFFFLK